MSARRLRPIAALGALSLGALLLSACAVDETPTLVLPASAMPTTSLANASVVPAAEREALPPIAGLALDGRPVVLNAWASWCEPCRVEAPELAAFAEANPAVRMVGLNVNDEPVAANAFAQATGIDYEQVVDADGAILATIPGIPPAGLPSTVVIDEQGRIAARIIGPLNGQLDAIVQQALGSG